MKRWKMSPTLSPGWEALEPFIIIARGPPLTDPAEAPWRVLQESIWSFVLFSAFSVGRVHENITHAVWRQSHFPLHRELFELGFVQSLIH